MTKPSLHINMKDVDHILVRAKSQVTKHGNITTYHKISFHSVLYLKSSFFRCLFRRSGYFTPFYCRGPHAVYHMQR